MEATLLSVCGTQGREPLREVSGQGPRRKRMLTWTLRSRRYIEERWTVAPAQVQQQQEEPQKDRKPISQGPGQSARSMEIQSQTPCAPLPTTIPEDLKILARQRF